ncbi:hypothetical protein, partial [Aeromonas dhakensis]|uniref:hypothetical protein n=1 Tax=Aeromonas dhakensis TaxID=196024 RepID=UPI002B47F39C
PAFLLSCFPAFLLSCFPAFLLSCFPASLSRLLGCSVQDNLTIKGPPLGGPGWSLILTPAF